MGPRTDRKNQTIRPTTRDILPLVPVARVIAPPPRGTWLIATALSSLVAACSFPVEATGAGGHQPADGATVAQEGAPSSDGSGGPAQDGGAATPEGAVAEDAIGTVDAAPETSTPGDAFAPDAAPIDAGGDGNPGPPPGIAGSPHVTLGVPIDADPADDYWIDDRYYVISYNSKREVPNWASWRLVAADLGSAPRQNDFRADALLPATFTPVGPNDYSGSGYDRGHMCPSADRTSTVDANSSTFLM